MDSREVIKAVKFIKDSCAVTSCLDCCFSDKKKGYCILSDEFNGSLAEIDIENLEKCIESEE